MVFCPTQGQTADEVRVARSAPKVWRDESSGVRLDDDVIRRWVEVQGPPLEESLLRVVVVALDPRFELERLDEAGQKIRSPTNLENTTWQFLRHDRRRNLQEPESTQALPVRALGASSFCPDLDGLFQRTQEGVEPGESSPVAGHGVEDRGVPNALAVALLEEDEHAPAVYAMVASPGGRSGESSATRRSAGGRVGRTTRLSCQTQVEMSAFRPSRNVRFWGCLGRLSTVGSAALSRAWRKRSFSRRDSFLEARRAWSRWTWSVRRG
jgi:hypothetical protein